VTGRPDPLRALPPAACVGIGIVSVQVGAGLAARLFSQVPPAGVTGLRLWTAAAVLALAGGRGLAAALSGLVRHRAWQDAAVAAGFGLSLAVMNYAIYQSFARIPLGVAVTVEFLGPLAVAVASSRRPLDLLWVGLAGAGVALLTRTGEGAAGHGSLPAGHGSLPAGLGFGLLAALGWAAYILLSRATGRRFPGSSGLAIAMLVAAAVVTPAGIAAGGSALLRPGVLVAGLAVGLLSSTVPYSLELATLRRLPARVFGIWMSLEPAVAALVGAVMLGQALAPRQWAAIGCVIAASAGAATTARRPPPPQA
jgi:inner membrane transporter RhtA